MKLRHAIRQYLSDGEWRTSREIATACGHLISPTVAAHYYDKGGSRRAMLRPDVFLVRAKISYMRHALDNARRESQPYIERGEGDCWRLIPGMPIEVRHGSGKLWLDQVAEIRRAIATGERDRAIAQRYAVSRDTIRCIRVGRSWRHVSESLEKPVPDLECTG